MVPKRIMVIAGEASGDLLGAELVQALRARLTDGEAAPTTDLQPLHTSLEPRFFGAGGPRLAEAGVELAFDMTAHAVVGLVEVLKKYGQFRRLFRRLFQMAVERQPHAIICVDFSGFNLRLAHAIKQFARREQGTFANWDPKIIQYVSPQVWASRPGRAQRLEHDADLLLSIFPFEKDWYGTRAPGLRVEFVGHPMIDRYARGPRTNSDPSSPPLVLLLPGSRGGELKRHLPVMTAAAEQIAARQPVRLRLILPNDELAARARIFAVPALRSRNLEVQVGGLAESLAETAVAIASTGTVTLECAYFGVPTVALYKTSWSTYEIGKRIIQVGFLAMPNVMAGQAIYPEYIQRAATPGNIAREALDLLNNPTRRTEMQSRLAKITRSLGTPGAADRAAQAIAELLAASERAFNLRAWLSQ